MSIGPSAASPTEVFGFVQTFLNTFDVGVASIGVAETRAAMDAFRHYGRASRHPAKLNLGDCFSYGIAKTREMPLLYKGNDFVHTPLGW